MVTKVSVLMPVYNGEKFIADAIGSVLSQTFSNFELVIVNDGSTDDSLKVIESFNDQRIVYVHNAENTGLANVRNKALGIARGEYIAWLDSDDISLPTRLEKQVRALDANPRLGLCGTWVKTIGGPSSDVWQYPTESDMLRSRMLFDDPLATSSVMMRFACLRDLDVYFDLDYPPAEDYQLWERISRQWELSNIPEILTLYRVHAAQTSVVKVEKQQAAIWAIQCQMLDQLDIAPTNDEMKLHIDIGAGWRFLDDRSRVNSAEQWLLRLASANSAKKVFPQAAFREVLAERWFYSVNAISGDGLSSWFVYNRSALSRWPKRRVWRLLRMLLKCMINGR